MFKIKPINIVAFMALFWMFITTIRVIEQGLVNAPSGIIWIQNIIFSVGWLVWAVFTPVIYIIYQRVSIISTKKNNFPANSYLFKSIYRFSILYFKWFSKIYTLEFIRISGHLLRCPTAST